MFPAASIPPPTPEPNLPFIPAIPLIPEDNEVDGEMMSLLLSPGPIPPLFPETEEVAYPILATAPLNVEPCEAMEPPSIATMPEACENHNANRLAADYVVDGEARQFSPKKIGEIKSRNALVKKKRNLGEAYTTEKTNKLMPAKRDAMESSKCAYCEFKELDCKKLTEAERFRIRRAFYDIGNLQKQREWLTRHISFSLPETQTSRRYSYFLPNIESGEKWQVCRSMLLSTIGISFQQVRTVMSKLDAYGVIECEKRGGRQLVESDRLLREEVVKHIEKFPRMESHYCRSNSKCQYLSSDLNFSILYRMYKEEHPMGASYSLYMKVFKSLNLKFHHPKKDTCGLCEVFLKSNDEQKACLQEEFNRHISEKIEVRNLKTKAKERASNDKKYGAAVFDLQQVVYVPKSARSESFYKRRLSCYNFTVYDLATKDGTCYFAQEGQTRRGSCEIASYLYQYLEDMDAKGVEKMDFFSDGCIGQNKNSVIPSMMLYFIETSKSIQEITLHFFETNHGQSEGDSMHSTIERAINQVAEIALPFQVISIISMARKRPKPYVVIPTKSSDIKEWKSLSQKKGILRVRYSESGKNIDWTKFMQVKVKKNEPQTIRFKYSHLDKAYEVINISNNVRRQSESSKVATPQNMYKAGYPKLSEAKYQDLQSLCSGPTPVLPHPEYQTFYRQLNH